MDKATSSESIGNQMSVMCCEQEVEQAEQVRCSNEIVESEVTLVNSKIVVPSSGPIETGAVTRSQSKLESDIDDGSIGSVPLSDETNRMLRDMGMTKFKEMQESDNSSHALWMKAKQNNSRYCISNELFY